ncbi:MAG: STAUR_1299 family protein [Deltaproteobacteria bacterium]|nr:STAUR_1299 family protein [Deltaproteobacteria bacterium]
MPLDLSPLWEQAFLEGEARDANRLLGEAREAFARLTADQRGEPFSYEVIVPEAPGADWLLEVLLPKLVYHCETRRAPLPECGAVFVSAFVGERLLCVPAAAFVALGRELLGCSVEELVERFGTGEVRHALGRDEDPPAARAPKLLPGGES